MNLEDSLKAFHLPKPNGWGHSTKPRIYGVMAKSKKKVIAEGHAIVLEQDEIDLLWYLHGSWERLSATGGGIYGVATQELRAIIAKRCEMRNEAMKRTDEDAANRLMDGLERRM